MPMITFEVNFWISRQFQISSIPWRCQEICYKTVFIEILMKFLCFSMIKFVIRKGLLFIFWFIVVLCAIFDFPLIVFFLTRSVTSVEGSWTKYDKWWHFQNMYYLNCTFLLLMIVARWYFCIYFLLSWMQKIENALKCKLKYF